MNRDAPLTLAPKVFRFSDIDQYRTAVRNLVVEFTTLVRMSPLPPEAGSAISRTDKVTNKR